MIGTRISHFKVLAKLGEGGMGVVYKAEDLDLGRVVALKVLPPHLVGDEDRRNRFVDEARTAAAVTHPNIATIHEIGSADGNIYIAMEYVEGHTVRELIDAGRLTLKETLRLASEIAAGLAAAHRAHIAHRDLKPDNICVGQDGHVKILDFGLARLLERDGPDRPAGGAVRTHGGVQPDSSAAEPAAVPADKAVTIPIGEQKVLGTPGYMSPEQARGLEVDYRTDLFSFGCTLYEMLTGRPPFRGPTPTSTLSDIVHKEPVSATTLNPEIPSSVQWILDKCLEKEPDHRYQDTRDLVVDLRHLFPEGTQTRTLEIGSWPPGSGPHAIQRRRRRWARIAVAAGLLVVVGGAAALLMRGRSLPVPAAEEHSLAVFAFENITDAQDPQRLGQIVQELLITDLSGLEPLKVFSSQRLSDVQRQLGRRHGAGDGSLATVVARRAGAQRMITGSLSQLGDRWILTSQMQEVATGRVLRSKRIDGADLYTMVDQLTGDIQHDFALQLPAELADLPLKEKTSTSMEAWRHYLGGVDYMNNSQFNEAVLELTRAVQIDSSFGQAYYQLGLATWWFYSDVGAGREHLVHFLDDKLHASKKEREMGEGMLFLVDMKYGEALPVFERLTQSYPDEKYAWYGRGEANFHFAGESKQHESLEFFQRAVALDPDFLLPYYHIFDVLFNEERFDEALALARQQVDRKPDSPLFHQYLAATIAMTGDIEGTERAVNEALRHCRGTEDRRELYKRVRTSWMRLEYMNLAEEYAEKAAAVDPQHVDPQIQLSLMNILVNRRKYDEYETRVRELMQKDPNSDLYRAALVWAHLIKHRFAEAREMAEKLAEQYPKNARWYWLSAKASILAGDEAGARSVIATALRQTPDADDLRALYQNVADAYAECGNLNRAREYYLMAKAAEPGQESASEDFAIGRVDLARGQLESAERWFRQAMQVAPRNDAGPLHMAMLSVERGQIPQAMEWIDATLKLKPPSKLLPLYAASLNILTGNLAEVGKLLGSDETNLAADYQKWELLYGEPEKGGPLGIGWAYLLAGDNREAQATFEHAASLELNQRDTAAYKGLGWTYLAAGDYKHAEQAFQQGMKIGYGHGDLLRGIGIAKLLQGDRRAAETYARRALTEDAPCVDALRLLGFALAGQGRSKEALEVATQAVAMDSTRTSLELQAWVLIDGNIDLKRGIEVANLAAQMPPRFLDVEKSLPHRVCAEHSLAHAYLKQGQNVPALQQLQKASALQPNCACIRHDLQRAQGLATGT